MHEIRVIKYIYRINDPYFVKFYDVTEVPVFYFLCKGPNNELSLSCCMDDAVVLP